MYNQVTNMVCFHTFFVKREKMICIENVFWGPNNFKDRTKFMILFHLQRLGT